MPHPTKHNLYCLTFIIVAFILPFLLWLTGLIWFANLFPHTLTERSTATVLRIAFLISAVLIAVAFFSLRLRRWIKVLLAIPVGLLVLANLGISWFSDMHHHCWEPQRYIETPKTISVENCE